MTQQELHACGRCGRSLRPEHIDRPFGQHMLFVWCDWCFLVVHQRIEICGPQWSGRHATSLINEVLARRIADLYADYDRMLAYRVQTERARALMLI